MTGDFNSAKWIEQIVLALESRQLDEILGEYRRLQDRIEQTFQSFRKHHPDIPLACGPGCTLCCHGLFEISLLDALVLTRDVIDGRVPPDAMERAQRLVREIEAAGWRTPQLYHDFDENSIGSGLSAFDLTGCPLLDDKGACSDYPDRPSICRFQGARWIDRRSDSELNSGCERNSALSFAIPFDFSGFDETEADLFEQIKAFAPCPSDWTLNEADTLVCSALNWLDGSRRR